MQHSCPPGKDIINSSIYIHVCIPFLINIQVHELQNTKLSMYTLNMINELNTRKNNSGSLASNTWPCNYILQVSDTTEYHGKENCIEACILWIC